VRGRAGRRRPRFDQVSGQQIGVGEQRRGVSGEQVNAGPARIGQRLVGPACEKIVGGQAPAGLLAHQPHAIDDLVEPSLVRPAAAP